MPAAIITVLCLSDEAAIDVQSKIAAVGDAIRYLKQQPITEHDNGVLTSINEQLDEGEVSQRQMHVLRTLCLRHEWPYLAYVREHLDDETENFGQIRLAAEAYLRQSALPLSDNEIARLTKQPTDLGIEWTYNPRR